MLAPLPPIMPFIICFKFRLRPTKLLREFAACSRDDSEVTLYDWTLENAECSLSKDDVRGLTGTRIITEGQRLEFPLKYSAKWEFSAAAIPVVSFTFDFRFPEENMARVDNAHSNAAGLISARLRCLLKRPGPREGPAHFPTRRQSNWGTGQGGRSREKAVLL